MIPDDIRKEHTERCRNCKIRKSYAKNSFYFDWRNCPFDCENDYKHYTKSIKQKKLKNRCPYCGGKIERRGSEFYCFSCHFWWEVDE